MGDAKKSQVLYWLRPEDVEAEVYVHSRSFFSRYAEISALTDNQIEEVIYKEHIYISKQELREIIYATLEAFNFQPKGVGLELGAGCAAISVELAKDIKEIKKIFAVEIVPEIVEIAQTSLISIAGVQDKVIPVLGDFDNLKVDDESIDWIIEFDSLHHSFDLEKTAKESYRVLKEGGTLIAIDRAHWNTSRERMRSLEKETYSKEFLLTRGWDSNKKITRADNGEHEHLVSDYQKHFLKAGFKSFQWKNLIAPEFSILKLSLISAIPWRLRASTKYRYIHMWPLWKVFLPVLLFRLGLREKYCNFLKLPRANNSKRFQSKTIFCITK
jgi:ubiquinone/menaquinone biosynthesis C-methylase UbiE